MVNRRLANNDGQYEHIVNESGQQYSYVWSCLPSSRAKSVASRHLHLSVPSNLATMSSMQSDSKSFSFRKSIRKFLLRDEQSICKYNLKPNFGSSYSLVRTL